MASRTLQAHAMKLGIIGFPQSGKTTLFRLLTGPDPGDLRTAAAPPPVVRAFPSPVLGEAPDPVRDAKALEEELILADLEVAERRLEKLEKGVKRKPPETEQR